jgi:hypothetical protein
MITPAYSTTATERVLPRMALDFTTGVLDPRVTFTRSTTATFVGSNGLIQTAAINAPRFDYDPVTLAPKGLLIEETRANLVLQSSDFETTWNAGTTSVSANTTVAPDGTTTADTVTATATSSFISQNITFTGDGVKAISFFLKAGTSGTSIIQVRDITALAGRGAATITWTAGVPTAVASSGGTIQGIDTYANGFYRIKLLLAGVVAANTNSLRLQPDSVSGTGTVIAWGAQAENGAFATSYIPTAASQVTRNPDAVSMTGANFTSWYNASAGTLSVSATGYNAATVAQGGVAPTAVSLYAIAATSPYASMAIVRRDAATLNVPTGYILSDTGTIGADIQQNTINWVGATVNAAIAWNGSTNAAFTANGLTVGTDTSYTLPTSDSLQIGRWGSEAVTGYWSGHIRKVSFYPQRLTNAELQAITK